MYSEFIETILFCLNDYVGHIEHIAKEFKALDAEVGYVTCSPYDMTILRHILNDTMRVDTTDENMAKKIFSAYLTVEHLEGEKF